MLVSLILCFLHVVSFRLCLCSDQPCSPLTVQALHTRRSKGTKPFASASATARRLPIPFSQNTRAVRLLTNGIRAKSNRSALAPALSRSLMCSNTLFNIPHPIVSQNCIIPAANPSHVCASVCTRPRAVSNFRATVGIGISWHRSRSWNAA